MQRRLGWVYPLLAFYILAVVVFADCGWLDTPYYVFVLHCRFSSWYCEVMRRAHVVCRLEHDRWLGP